jgi:hypothetical protein
LITPENAEREVDDERYVSLVGVLQATCWKKVNLIST